MEGQGTGLGGSFCIEKSPGRGLPPPTCAEGEHAHLPGGGGAGVGCGGRGRGLLSKAQACSSSFSGLGMELDPREEAQGGVLNMQGVGAECVFCSYLWTKGRPLKGAGYSQSQGLGCGEGPWDPD